MINPEHSGRILKVSRLEGLVDGIFSVAMTILVLDLHLPDGFDPAQISSFLHGKMLHHLFVYVASFIILGTLWIAMNFQWGLLERINRYYLWANLFYLMIICIVPFSASLVATSPKDPACLMFYTINLLAASLGQLIICQCGAFFNLYREIYTPDIHSAIVRRIFVAPIFYITSLFIVNLHPLVAFFLLLAPTALYLIPGRVDKFD